MEERQKQPNDEKTPSSSTNTPNRREISMRPTTLLRCIVGNMVLNDSDMLVTVPKMTTWKHALRATEAAIRENQDQRFMATHPKTEAQRAYMRKMALEEVESWKNTSAQQLPLPPQRIRTMYDTGKLPSPQRLSKEAREKLKENSRPFETYGKPYPVTLRTKLTKATLPVVQANITLAAIDGSDTDIHINFDLVDMLWDTGAHQTIISEEFLSEPFLRYLQDPIHDAYRSEDGVRVQLDAVIAFSNVPVELSAIVLVVPKTVVPNERVGVLFGQKMCINSLNYRSIPRGFLTARGEVVSEDIWGDFVIDEFIDVDGNLCRV